MITSTSNIQVKELLRLQKKSREREKEGVFIVEGRAWRKRSHGSAL